MTRAATSTRDIIARKGSTVGLIEIRRTDDADPESLGTTVQQTPVEIKALVSPASEKELPRKVVLTSDLAMHVAPADLPSWFDPTSLVSFGGHVYRVEASASWETESVEAVRVYLLRF